MEKYMYCYSKDNNSIFKDKIFTCWFIDENLANICYYYLYQTCGNNEANITGYIFDFKDIVEASSFVEGKEYIICYIQSINVMDEIFKIEKFKIVKTKKELNKILSLSDNSYIFPLDKNMIDISIKEYKQKLEDAEKYSMRTVHFNNGIVITDPCYIVKDRDERELCDNYENMKALGFKEDSLVHDTLYGDWSCTTLNSDTNEVLGHFCANSGTVCVFSFQDVLNYNPEFFDELEKHPHIATVLKDFLGDVCFKLIDKETLSVVGSGSINFNTIQTGL